MYSVSRYNLVVQKGDFWYLFNTNKLTAICLKNELFLKLLEVIQLIKSGECIDFDGMKVVDFLCDKGFIVPDGQIEFYDIENRYKSSCDDEALRLTIVPTTECDMRCSYCFEGMKKDIERWSLKRGYIDRIIAFADKRLKNNGRIIAHWFGGEPILRKDIIFSYSENLMELAAKKNASYESWITTNGYGLDGATAKKLKSYQVKKAQITLDGQKTYHDSIRYIERNGARVGSFDKILNNIEESSEFLKIVVRFNISPQNIEGIRELAEYMAKLGLNEKIAYVSVSLIEKNMYFNGEVYDEKNFAGVEHSIFTILNDCGFVLHSPFSYYTGCMADKINSYLIDADETVKKCTHFVGDSSNINEVFNVRRELDITVDDLYESRENINRFDDEECLSCVFFPLCMQGCIMQKMERREKKCPTIKYNWRDVLPFFYDIEKHY